MTFALRSAVSRAASLVGGVLLGLLALELSLRLVTYEHEADGNYWGRGAFVTDPELGYRHAPSTAAIVGRFGAFGPSTLVTNELGFRDQRLPLPDASRTQGPPRLMVVGASYLFGLGVDDDAELFHRRLEGFLRERPDVPDDLLVFNVSQTGYRLSQLEALTRRELERFAPDMVLLAMRPAAPVRPEQDEVDIVNGYRLSGARVGRGSWLDELRTRSAAFMSAARSPLLESRTYVARQLLVEAGIIEWHDTSADATRSDPDDVLRILRRLARFLDERHIAFAVMEIHGQDAAAKPAPLRRREPFATVDVHPTAAWPLDGDHHWRAIGHLEAARQVAAQLPTAALRRRGGEPR
jgi:hypothetical protein